jgi:hypothetical protein
MPFRTTQRKHLYAVHSPTVQQMRADDFSSHGFVRVVLVASVSAILGGAIVALAGLVGGFWP